MTKHEAAREIIRQGGGCSGVRCGDCPHSDIAHSEVGTEGPTAGPIPANVEWMKAWLAANPGEAQA